MRIDGFVAQRPGLAPRGCGDGSPVGAVQRPAATRYAFTPDALNPGSPDPASPRGGTGLPFSRLSQVRWRRALTARLTVRGALPRTVRTMRAVLGDSGWDLLDTPQALQGRAAKHPEHGEQVDIPGSHEPRSNHPGGVAEPASTRSDMAVVRLGPCGSGRRATQRSRLRLRRVLALHSGVCPTVGSMVETGQRLLSRAEARARPAVLQLADDIVRAGEGVDAAGSR